jgi:hypothetical protein
MHKLVDEQWIVGSYSSKPPFLSWLIGDGSVGQARLLTLIPPF